MFQNETLLRFPPENYEPYRLGMEAQISDFNDRRYRNDTSGFPVRREIWESVVAVPVWREGEIVELRLHPITLGFGESRPQRGRPMFAGEELGRKIINDLIERSEAFGIAMLEALACGRPAVSTRLGTGVEYVNLDRVTGLTVPPKDAQALADAVCTLLGDDASREQMGAAARKRTQEEFSLDRTVERTIEVYRSLLGETESCWR